MMTVGDIHHYSNNDQSDTVSETHPRRYLTVVRRTSVSTVLLYNYLSAEEILEVSSAWRFCDN